MLRDGTTNVETTWGDETAAASRASYREIDKQLRAIAKSKARLEVEEAKWLREAEKHRIWRQLGFATALEYLEHVFGYSPRTAKDRLRVAKELGELPELANGLRDGTLPYSAARELSRVMTRATAAQWLARARGKNVHDIQALVAGHKKGDTPDSPKDSALMTSKLVLELAARQQALLQQARSMFEAERGEHLALEDVIEALCKHALAGGSESSAKAPRPAHQIVIRKCDDCLRAVQCSPGRQTPLTDDELAQAECDAEVVREADIADAQANGRRRPAPTLTIPKKVRDLVWARDQGCCRFPGCRAKRNLALHHLEFQMHGGAHIASNLILLCDGHHKLLHDGVVTITGQAPDGLVFTRDGEQVVDPRTSKEREAGEKLRTEASQNPKPRSRFDDVEKLVHAKQALRQLGFNARDAKRAIEAAWARVGSDVDIPTLVQTVLAMSREASAEPDHEDVPTLARKALVQAGYSPAVAAKAVEAARAHVGTTAALEVLVVEALRRCAER
jgi:Holliday junction resolvasome RuvABC DNA-binding subunit